MPLLVVAHRGLEDHRHRGRARVHQEALETGEGDSPCSDVGVPILARAELADRVVQVHSADKPKSQDPLDIGEEALDSPLAPHVVARREGVTGVEAVAEALGLLCPGPNGRELFEGMSDNGSLTGGELEQDLGRGTGSLDADSVQRRRDGGERGVDAAAQVGARVHDDAVEPQRRRPTELVGEPGTRLLDQRLVGGGEVDEIGRVGDDRRPAVPDMRGTEFFGLLGGERLRSPLTRTLDEDLQRVAAESGAALEGERDPAGRRDVGTQERSFHRLSLTSRRLRRSRLPLPTTATPGDRLLDSMVVLARLLAMIGRVVRAVALLAVFVVAAYLAFSFWVRRGVTAVPAVAGLSEAEARGSLDSSGLVFQRAEAGQWSTEVPAGAVLETRPRAGSFVKRNAVVEAVLSLGSRRITVPDLGGKALSAARLTLETEGLGVGATLAIVSDRAPAGSVVGQEPLAGAELAPGERVSLLTALDESPTAWVMPDLVALRYDPVRSTLEHDGFLFGSVTFEPYEGVVAGTILRQSPLPGHPVRRADAISLVVAAEPAGAAL